MLKHVDAGPLSVAYEEHGPAAGAAVVLLHGFPYDVRAYDEVTPLLVAKGCRVVTPYLRGYGPTTFRSAGTMRSGQQAALAHDLLALMDALSIPSAVLAGYDWGGRAACIAAALWPERVNGAGFTFGVEMCTRPHLRLLRSGSRIRPHHRGCRHHDVFRRQH